MKVLIIAALVCLDVCWSACPATNCEDKFDKNIDCQEALRKVDDCYKAIDGNECDCDEKELGDYYKWQEYIRDIYEDRYCLKASECQDPEALECLERYEDIDSVFYRKDTGDSEDESKVENAKDCVNRVNKGEINDDGCGWSVGPLKQDKTAYTYLWTAWLNKCDVKAKIKKCFTGDDFTKTLCESSKLSTFTSCLADAFWDDRSCDDLPTNSGDIKDQLFGSMISKRCKVYDALEGCKKKKSNGPINQIRALLGELMKQK